MVQLYILGFKHKQFCSRVSSLNHCKYCLCEGKYVLVIYYLSFISHVQCIWEFRKMKREDQVGGVGRHGAHLPPQIYQKYIYMWRSSHWKLTIDWKNLFCNQCYKKKNPHGVGYEWGNAISWEPPILERDIEEKGNIIGLGGVGTTYWGLTLGRWVPFACLETSGTYRRAIRNIDMDVQSTFMLAYSWEQGRGIRLKLPKALVPLTAALLPTRLKSFFAQESAHLGKMETAQPQYCI